MYAWVLAGGGANGAFEAGVMSVLAENGHMPDLIVGTSVGALNGLKAAHFGKHQGGACADALEDLWFGIGGDRDIYKKWFCGLLPAPLPFFLNWRKSVYSSAPLRKKVYAEADLEAVRASGTQFVAVAVEWTSRSAIQTWDQDSPVLLDAVLASSSYPIFFEPVKIDGRFYTDGGVREISPLKVAIDLGATKIDLVGNSPTKLPALKSLPGGLNQIKRFANIVLDEVDKDDYRLAEHVNARVRCGCEVNPKWRLLELHRTTPDIDLGDSLDFSPSKNRRLFEYGQACGIARVGGT